MPRNRSGSELKNKAATGRGIPAQANQKGGAPPLKDPPLEKRAPAVEKVRARKSRNDRLKKRKKNRRLEKRREIIRQQRYPQNASMCAKKHGKDGPSH